MNLLDNIIENIDPEAALRRQTARLKLTAVKQAGSTTKQFSNTGYSNGGAKRTGATYSAYDATGGSPDEDITANLAVLRERSRDQFMTNPVANGIIKNITTHAVGGGLICKPKPDADYLGWDDAQAKAWAKNVSREWDLFSNTTDVSREGMYKFDTLQVMALTSALMSGDCFALMTDKKRRSNPYSLVLHLIEGDRCCNPLTSGISAGQRIELPTGGFITGGLEFDADQSLKGYHIANFHPLSKQGFAKRKWSTVMVEPSGKRSGRKNILHLMNTPERPEQKRGVPLLAPIITHLLQISRYTEAELTAAVVTSLLTVFIKTAGPDLPFGEELIDTETGQPVATHQPGIPSGYKLGSATMLELGKDDSVEIVDPKRPASGFGGFLQAVCEQIGPSVGLPYEVLLQHFSSSYSASKAALLIAWKMFMVRRLWLASEFCQPTYEEFMAEGVALGRIPAPGFFDDPLMRAAYCKSAWHGPAQGSINPKDEIAASISRIAANISTGEIEAAELNGTEYEENLMTNARHLQMQRDNNIPIVGPNGMLLENGASNAI